MPARNHASATSMPNSARILLHRYPGDLRVEIADSPQIGHELAKDDAGALGPARPLFERESQWRVARGLRFWVNELPEVPAQQRRRKKSERTRAGRPRRQRQARQQRRQIEQPVESVVRLPNEQEAQ